MDRNELLNEIKDSPLEELEFIYENQKDLYSAEEMEIIKEKIEQFKKEERAKIEKMLPKEIECSKCFGKSPFENDTCIFCGAKFNKEKYYSLDYYENQNKNYNEEGNESYIFQYIISLLIPLVGFILGGILLSKEDKEKVDIGKICIILGIFSIIVSVLILSSM